MSKNEVTTINARKATSSNPLESFYASKIKSDTQKTPPVNKHNTPFSLPTKLYYDLLKDLKITKENIYLFELIKLP
jgi:hypothetical protein